MCKCRGRQDGELTFQVHSADICNQEFSRSGHHSKGSRLRDTCHVTRDFKRHRFTSIMLLTSVQLGMFLVSIILSELETLAPSLTLQPLSKKFLIVNFWALGLFANEMRKYVFIAQNGFKGQMWQDWRLLQMSNAIRVCCHYHYWPLPVLRAMQLSLSSYEEILSQERILSLHLKLVFSPWKMWTNFKDEFCHLGRKSFWEKCACLKAGQNCGLWEIWILLGGTKEKIIKVSYF